MELDIDISAIKGVGDVIAKKLKHLGVETASDLIDYYPRRYEDYSTVQKIKEIKPGNAVTICAEIKQVTGRYVRRGMHITEALASDDTGSMRIIWFNQPYRAGAIKSHQQYFISGLFELSRGRLSIQNPSMELKSAFPVNTARIVPIYRETKGLKSATIRKIMRQLQPSIANLPETLPSEVISANKLLSHSEALLKLHFPKDTQDIDIAKRRLGFEELFAISLAGLLNKAQFQSYSGVHIPFDEVMAKKFVAQLPFSLTDAQRKIVWQIYKDLQHKHPMNRLIEGDVGSGKTVVATMAAIMAMNKGYQVALMAPTEILARQHAETLYKLLEPLGLQKTIVLLVGSMKEPEKRKARKSFSDGSSKLMVGTHALITDKTDMHNLGLVIIDEQHRFGVEQREKLLSKAGRMPHLLSMTATPIPRTLALTLYGELDISLLDEMPPGRTLITTQIVSPNSRQPVIEHIKRELDAGRQMFVVCPLISESDHLPTLSAETVHQKLSGSTFKDYRVGLLHGKQSGKEKEQIMQDFVSRELDILVSTTVIEVGVDVPNATIMMIEGAERFGLAQVHQLRGRVGRGKHPGYCYLVMSDSQEPTRRLRALEKSSNGFELAQLDLDIRGPGAIYGRAQHGQLDLRVANLSDSRLVAAVRLSAQEFIDSGEKLEYYPQLAQEVARYRTITNLN